MFCFFLLVLFYVGADGQGVETADHGKKYTDFFSFLPRIRELFFFFLSFRKEGVDLQTIPLKMIDLYTREERLILFCGSYSPPSIISPKRPGKAKKKRIFSPFS